MVVGPMDNNVYVLRCSPDRERPCWSMRPTSTRRSSRCAPGSGVRQVVETHGHWDHIQAVPAVREAGISVSVTAQDAGMLPSYDLLLEDDTVLEIGRLRIRTILTPGHTRDRCASRWKGPRCCSVATPSSPGARATLVRGRGLPDHHPVHRGSPVRPVQRRDVVLPGHGASTTIGSESPHLGEWIDRGW